MHAPVLHISMLLIKLASIANVLDGHTLVAYILN